MDKHHLAACHCKTTHEELFLYKSDSSRISFRSDDLKDKIEYVEDTCEDALRWNAVKSNSKDYIWPLYCPMYGVLRRGLPRKLDDAHPLRNLLVEGWRILLPGGKIMIHISKDDDLEKMKESLIKFNEVNENNLWKIDTVELSSLDYFVYKKSRPSISHYIQLTKTSSGGKKRKTMRHKRIRNAQKYHRIR